MYNPLLINKIINQNKGSFQGLPRPIQVHFPLAFLSPPPFSVLRYESLSIGVYDDFIAFNNFVGECPVILPAYS